MQRYFLRLSFHGKNYHGWQVQENAHTVQAELNKALALLTRREVETTGCGRTDTGVHAREFYVHFDLPEPVQADDFVRHLNGILPQDIAVHSLIPLHPEAHARFDATARRYVYQIYHSKDPFLRDYAAFFPYALDLQRMNQLAALLLDHKDFGAFSKSNTQVFTNHCTVMHAEWTRQEEMTVFTIQANRFLRNMVRAIVGTLLLAGEHKIGEKEFLEILKSGDRKEAGMSMPACGLYLVKVDYPYALTKNE